MSILPQFAARNLHEVKTIRGKPDLEAWSRRFLMPWITQCPCKLRRSSRCHPHSCRSNWTAHLHRLLLCTYIVAQSARSSVVRPKTPSPASAPTTTKSERANTSISDNTKQGWVLTISKQISELLLLQKRLVFACHPREPHFGSMLFFSRH